MDPSRNPDLFGYSFTEEMEAPAPQAQIQPAPGSALLDRGETETFHDFFNKFDLPNFDGELDLTAPFGSLDTDGGAWHDWNPLTIPVFQGSSTSLHHPTFASNNDFYNLGISSPPVSLSTRRHLALQQRSLQIPPSVNVNSPHSRQPPITLNPFDTIPAYRRRQVSESFPGREILATVNTVATGCPDQHLMPSPDLPGTGRVDSKYFDDDSSSFHPFGNLQKSALSGLETRIPQFGSDSNFHRKGYLPPPDQRKPDDMPGLILTALERQSSAANTQPSSPVVYKRKRQLPNFPEEPEATLESTWTNGRDSQVIDDSRVQIVSEPQVHKRQKSSMQENGSSLDQPLNHSPGKRKIRAKPAGFKARRNSSKSEQKPPRQNLTEDQKRENHILSEQKRRDLIKQGFDQLFDLLPATKAAGSSRSQQLCVAADWLEELVAGNARLRQQLITLGGR